MWENTQHDGARLERAAALCDWLIQRLHCVLSDAARIMLVAASRRSGAKFRSYIQGPRSTGINYKDLRDIDLNIKVCLWPGMRRNT